MAPAAVTESRRGQVESAVKRITDAFMSGKIETPDGRPLTPYICAKMIQENDGLDVMPSSGSVSAVFDRWKAIGFAKIGGKPFAFTGYTVKGLELGLAELKARYTAKLKKESAKAAK